MFETTKQPIDVLGPITISGDVTVFTLFLLVKFPDFPHLLQAPDPHQCASTEHQGWHLSIRIAGILQEWADSGGCTQNGGFVRENPWEHIEKSSFLWIWDP